MKITEKEKQEFIHKICESKTFKNATTSSALLLYLHKATLRGGTLKEMVIDIEFFGTNNPADKSNPRVRVNVYNLRKKLIQYYEDEGNIDKWQVSIEKGQYQVSFTKRETNLEHLKHYDLFKILPYAALLIAITIIIITNTTPKPPNIWRSLISSTHDTHLYIGDAFGAVGNTITGKRGFTRDYRINSYAEFFELLENKPELKGVLKPSPFTYASSMGVISVQRFQHYFDQYKHAFTIRFATQMTTSDIKEGNAIYIGNIWDKNQFINIFNEGNPYCKINPLTLCISGHTEIPDTTYDITSPNEFQEYAIVSKYPSTGNTEHLIFISRHDIGVSATVDYFTNADSLKSFTKNYLKKDDYFTAIFKVEGQDRTNTSIKLKKVVAF